MFNESKGALNCPALRIIIDFFGIGNRVAVQSEDLPRFLPTQQRHHLSLLGFFVRVQPARVNKVSTEVNRVKAATMQVATPMDMTWPRL